MDSSLDTDLFPSGCTPAPALPERHLSHHKSCNLGDGGRGTVFYAREKKLPMQRRRRKTAHEKERLRTKLNPDTFKSISPSRYYSLYELFIVILKIFGIENIHKLNAGKLLSIIFSFRFPCYLFYGKGQKCTSK
jgi:hypothetical protein